MTVRQDFEVQCPLPPRAFMQQIMDNVSKTYCFLWQHKNKHNRFSMKWNDLSRYYHKHAFRSNVRKLNNEGLLSYEESAEGISIELVGWDEIEAAL